MKNIVIALTLLMLSLNFEFAMWLKQQHVNGRVIHNKGQRRSVLEIFQKFVFVIVFYVFI